MRRDGVNIKVELCPEIVLNRRDCVRRAAACDLFDERHSFTPGNPFIGSV